MHELSTVSHADLEASEERLRLVLDATSDGAWDWDVQSNTAVYSEQWLKRHGFTDEDTHSQYHFWESIIHPDDKARVLAALQAHLRGETESFESEYRIRLGSGEWNWTLDRGKVVSRDQDGQPQRMVGTNKNIDDRVKAQNALVESEMLNRLIVENSSECIKLLDAQGRMIFINGPGLRAMELDASADVLGKYWPDLWPSESREMLVSALANAITEPQQFIGFCPTAKGRSGWWDVNINLIAPDITRTQAATDQEARYLVTSRDVTESRTFSEQLQRAAYYDAVTDLPNRRLFRERFKILVERAAHEHKVVALALYDIDNFRQINDTLGTLAGDLLLQEFAERIQVNIRKSDLAARLGEDEFAVIMSDSKSVSEIMAACQSISARLEAPFVYDGHAIDCQASCGVSFYPDHGDDADTLFTHANLALHASRETRSGDIRLFEPKMRNCMDERNEMLELARDALQANRISPYYQPKVELGSGKIYGFEALLRWRRPRKGWQLPATIGAAFEDLNLAHQISNRMIDGVIRDIRAWLDDGVDFGHVGINASAAEFVRDEFCERLLDKLRHANISPEYIELEVTETVFFGRGSSYVERALQLLSAEGVRIALDDFGTGYASLTHLKQFPVDIIKIDQSFIREMEDHPDNTAIIKAVLALGKNLGIEIVAEGIETPMQSAWLWAQGCTYGQGFMYGKAMPARRVPKFIEFAAKKRWRSGGLASRSQTT